MSYWLDPRTPRHEVWLILFILTVNVMLLAFIFHRPV